MDKTQKYSLVALTGLVAVVVLLKWRGHPSVAAPVLAGVDEPSASASPTGQAAFDAPFLYQTPGIADNAITLNGGAPFQSSINVNVNPSYLGTLSQDYIPLFGFVGIGNGAAQAGELTAPPPPAYYPLPVAANSPYVAPQVYKQPSPFWRPNVAAG